MKIIVDDKIPFIRGKIERLADDVVYLPGTSVSRNDVADADILVVRTRTVCNRELLEGSRVKLIVTATIGYDHIDTEYCDEAGIKWTNCPGCNARSVCQYISNALQLLNVGSGITIGVVGVGHVGSLVVELARKSGYKVLMSDPPLEESGAKDHDGCRFVSLDEICEKADVITFHTPLTHTGKHPTYHLADRLFFSKLSRCPAVINASRGGVVDEEALKEALRNGTVSKAVIDTWENEPRIDSELLRLATIATPHIAGYSANGKLNATLMSLISVRDFLVSSKISGTELESVEFSIPLPDAPFLSPDTLADDSKLLKENPDRFESFRGNYPVRIEIPSLI